MRSVPDLIRALHQLDRDIDAAQDHLNKMKAKRMLMATVDLPEAMTELGSSTFTTDDGFRCRVGYKIYGSLPSRENPDARAGALAYLKENEGEGLIRSDVTVSFGKGDIRGANRTLRMLTVLKEEGKIHSELAEPLLSVDSDVHPMSLQAWGRRRVEANVPTDLAAVGLRGMTIAEVKRED